MLNSIGEANFPENPLKKIYAYYQFKLARDSPSDDRNTHLEVASNLCIVAVHGDY